jgi:NADH-quinone oxidoreductase subunit N
MLEVTTSLNSIIDQAGLLLPEVILLLGSIILLLVDIVVNKRHHVMLHWIFLAVIIVCGAILVVQQTPLEQFEPVYVWDVLIIDEASFIFQLIFMAAGLFYVISQWRKLDATDLFLALSILLGAGIVVKSVNLLVLLIGIEILSISAYALTAKQPSGAAKEAGIKYIIFGAASTAVFLFGISLLYGLTGELNINTEAFTEKLLIHDGLSLMFIFLFVLAGLFFKITAFPFHLWAPDVYQSIPAPLAAFFSVVPKIAVVGFLVKLAMVINLYGLVEVPWKELLGGVAILTMTIGNLAALSQQNPQRMMAYSSIAHTGFFLMGIVAFHLFAFHAVLFYSAIYLFMNFLAFLLLYFYKERYSIENVNDFRGRMASAPVHGVLMVIVMISLTGLPPTAGFTAKLFIFSALLQQYQETAMSLYWIMLLAGILNTILSLFYYLKIPYYLIFKPSASAYNNDKMALSRMNFLLLVLVLPLLIVFIWPGILMDWINMVKFAL